MKTFSKRLITAVLSLFLFSLIIGASTEDMVQNSDFGANAPKVEFFGGASYAKVNGETVWLRGEIISIGSAVYIAPEEVLTACGFNVGWKDDIKAVALYKNDVTSYIITNSTVLWKGPFKYTSPNKTIIYKGVFYIPLDMLTYLLGNPASVTGDMPAVRYMTRDLLSDTYVGNTYRFSNPAASYKNIYLSGNFGMEKLSITDSAAKSYASAVNHLASAMPDNVNIFCIAVPSAAEFYGAPNVYTNQTAGIRTLYSNLSDRVIPINIVKPLYNHAGENIYFRTDHHWTQRGAYYAYREFMEIKGETVPEIWTYPVTYGSYVGSLASFSKGTAAESILKGSPDSLEKFSAPNYVAGASYNDMYMKNYKSSLRAVYENWNTYTSFIGGDNPLSVFVSNCQSGKKLVVLKESFGNAFSTWALSNYSEVYVIDVRKFNNGTRFNLKDFYNFVHFDDLVIINYPGAISSSSIQNYIRKFADA